MPMRAPASRLEINLDVTCPRRLIAKLHDCAAKIGPTLAIQKTGMKNPHASAVQGGKLPAQQALVSPDSLQ